MNESIEFEGAVEDIQSELASRDDIPNYLKPYIKDQVLQDAGSDGVGYHDWDLDRFVEDLLEERDVGVMAIWNDGDDAEDDIEIKGLPLKFSFDDLNAKLKQMFPDRKGIEANMVDIQFLDSGMSFCAEHTDAFDDPQWRNDVAESGSMPMQLDNVGDASRIFTRKGIKMINPSTSDYAN